MRYPDFENNIKKVLLKQKPARPTLFEFLISEEAESVLSGYELKNDSIEERIKRKVTATKRQNLERLFSFNDDAEIINGKK